MRKDAKKTPVLRTYTGVYLTREQDRILRVYVRLKKTKYATFLRKMIAEWIVKNKFTEPRLVSDLLECTRRDWEIQKLQNINNPGKAVNYAEFLRKTKLSFKWLPRDITEFLMIKLKDETDGQK